LTSDESKDSTERAHEITFRHFGTSEWIREISAVEREIYTRDEARAILTILVNKPLKSAAGMEATISKNSIEKILSGKAVDKSFDAKAHFLAAANLEKLFSHAIELFKFPMIFQKNNENYRDIYRLYAPMSYNKRIVPVKFTIIEMKNEIEGRRIYSLEAIDVNISGEDTE
jgi:hypothetical protein